MFGKPMSEQELGRTKIAFVSMAILAGIMSLTWVFADHLPSWAPLAAFLGGGVLMQLRGEWLDRRLKARLAREEEPRRHAT